MKHLKFIHLLVGLLALAALLVDGSIVAMLIGESQETPASAVLLLASALINLCLGSYLSTYRCGKRHVQHLASLLLIVATAISAWSLFKESAVIAEMVPSQIVSLLLTIAVLLHTAINLNTLKSSTPEAIPVDDFGRETGTVKWFNVSKGFGFITRDLGDDVFVHYRAIRGEGHRTLSEGQRVEFIIVEKDKGLQAEDVIAAAKGR